MPELCFAGCRHFHAEVAAAVAAEGWTDVQTVALPARCGRPPLDEAEVARALPDDGSPAVLMGGACLAGLQQGGGSAATRLPRLHLQALAPCFHLLAGASLVDRAVAAGGHLVTPGWLAQWREHLADTGMPVDMAADFFHEHAREIVLLDSGVRPEAEAELAAFAAAVKLPARRIEVGLDTLRLQLARWRAEAQLRQSCVAADERMRQHHKALADQALGIELLHRLVQAQDEDEAVRGITELVTTLFAPSAWAYERVDGETRTPAPGADPALLAALPALDRDLAWTDDGQGFMLPLRGKDLVGRLAVRGFAFPEHRQRYASLAVSLSGPLALAVEGIRLRRRLQQSEKMASLGVLVAGVAHEINTPLGVDLVAVSALQAQTRSIAERFAAHRMTQDDLERYLRQTGEEAALIRQNLERMGALVDAFRAVAVGGAPPPATRFGLRGCIEEVLLALGPRLPRERVQVQLSCDPALQVHSHRADWACILDNLLSNSLRHGYGAEGRGCIVIAVTSSGGRLCLDYRDDGRGMPAKALAQLFDPFFTSNPAQGMGLGMHLVHNLVHQRLHGSIHADSAPGQGLHLRIEVPL